MLSETTPARNYFISSPLPFSTNAFPAVYLPLPINKALYPSDLYRKSSSIQLRGFPHGNQMRQISVGVTPMAIGGGKLAWASRPWQSEAAN